MTFKDAYHVYKVAISQSHSLTHLHTKVILRMLRHQGPEVGIYKRKQESKKTRTRSRKRSRKQEKRKKTHSRQRK